MEWIVNRNENSFDPGGSLNNYGQDNPCEVTGHFTKQPSKVKVKNELSSTNIQKLHIIKKHIEQHFLMKHTLLSLCRHGGINEFVLKKGFRKLFNTGAIEYVRLLRMEYAKSLLQNTNICVSEVSMQIGYRHPHHFSTAYKNFFGASPKKHFSVTVARNQVE